MSTEAKVAFVFPGQGSQRVGMGQKLWDHDVVRRTFEEADDTLRMNITSLCLNGPKELLDQTAKTQPAIVTASIAALRYLKQQGVEPDQVVGHSLGEYSALVAAEALTFWQALTLVQARGEFMEEAGRQHPGMMAALLLPIDEVRRICEESGAEIANINTENQIVISGNNDAVTVATRLARDRGGRAIGLRVSIAAHSSLMQTAQHEMEIVLDYENIDDPKIPIVANTTGNYVTTGAEVRRCLVDQLTGSVLWLDSIRLMRQNGVDRFIEVGPGRVLSDLIQRIDPTATVDRVEIW